MKNIASTLIILFFSILSYSQTECDYNFSFVLRDTKGKIVKKVRRKEIGKHEYISQYLYKNKRHYFTIGRIGYCDYELILKKKGKRLVLKFHNKRANSSFVNLGTLILKDTTLHFYDGSRTKPLPIKPVLPKKPTPKPVPEIEIDTSNSIMLPVYGGFKSTKLELITNRIGIDPTGVNNKYVIANPLGIKLKSQFDVYALSKENIDRLYERNKQYSSSLKLGKVYRLTFTELVPERTMQMTYFGEFVVKLQPHVTSATLTSFAIHNKYTIETYKFAPGTFIVKIKEYDLFSDYKIIAESGLFEFIEPSFSAHQQFQHRKSQQPNLKLLNHFEIDSVIFYSDIMNEDIENSPKMLGKSVITKTGIYSFKNKLYKDQGVRVNYRFRLSQENFDEAKFMLDGLPKKYIETSGVIGDCLVEPNQSSIYECCTLIIYKNNGTVLTLKRNNLPIDLNSYYYKAYHINREIRRRIK